MKVRIIVIAAVLVVIFTGLAVIMNGLSEGANATIQGIDLSNIPNGRYTGTYNFKRWTNTVAVDVHNQTITGIETVNDVFAAQITNSSAEIFSRVIEAQDTKIDVVSGATVTSKAYLKAIEDALNNRY